MPLLEALVKNGTTPVNGLGATLLRCAAFIVCLAHSGCSPKPGARLTVKGELREIDRPAGVSSTAMDGERFYWVRGDAIVTRPLAGGAERILGQTSAPFEPLVLTRDDVAFWSDVSKLAITIVPKAGGEPRQVSVVANVRDGRRSGLNHAGPLAALDDALLWSEQRDGDVVLFSLHARTPGAAPLEIARVGGTAVTIEAAGNAFALLLRVSDGYRVDACDAVGAPLRTVHHVASRASDDDFVSMRVGARHVFVTHPSSYLSTAPVPLVAIPLAGGEPRVVDPRACPGPLAVLGDDPLYLSAKRCPGEFPEAQRLDLLRHHLDGSRAETVYSVYGGSVSVSAVGPRTVILDERIPLRLPQGSAPMYEKRAAQLTLP